VDLPQAARRIKERWDRFFETVRPPAHCLFCEGNRVTWNGSRARTASVLIEDAVVFLGMVLCRRVKCHDCRRSWTLRPPGLSPRRHYQLDVVAAATSAYAFGETASQERVAARWGCVRRTLARWLGWVAALTDLSTLRRGLQDVAGHPVILPRPDPAPSPRRTCAARVLALLEALGMALGVEPPGLRGVLTLVVGDEDRVSTQAFPRIPDFARRLHRGRRAILMA
jgi:hypothetical protein